MSLAIAVDRLYETGWLPDGDQPIPASDLDRLPAGLRYPTVAAVIRLFVTAGLELTVTQHLMFKCHRAAWRPTAGTVGDAGSHGTVVGNCDREAAVYALAHLRAARSRAGVASVGPALSGG